MQDLVFAKVLPHAAEWKVEDFTLPRKLLTNVYHTAFVKRAEQCSVVKGSLELGGEIGEPKFVRYSENKLMYDIFLFLPHDQSRCDNSW